MKINAPDINIQSIEIPCFQKPDSAGEKAKIYSPVLQLSSYPSIPCETSSEFLTVLLFDIGHIISPRELHLALQESWELIHFPVYQLAE